MGKSKENTIVFTIEDQVIQLVTALPNDFTVEDIIEELYFKIQVDVELKELDAGKGIPHDKVKDEMSERLKR